MSQESKAARIRALEAEVAGVRATNETLRQRVKELDARLLRQQEQSQVALAEAEAKVVELRIALGTRLKIEAEVAEERAAKGRPAAPQVGEGASKG